MKVTQKREIREREYLVPRGSVTQIALLQIACSPLKGALKRVGVCGVERRQW